MIKCENCGRENDDSFKFCLDCGTNLQPVQTIDPSSRTPRGQIPPVSIPPASSESPTSTTSGTVIIEPIIVHSAPPPPTPSASTSAALPYQSSTDAVTPEPGFANEPHAAEPHETLPSQPSRTQPPTPAAASHPSGAGASTVWKIVCRMCGNSLHPDDLFCSACGQRQGRDVQRGGKTVFMHVASPALSQKPKACLVLIEPDGSEGTVFSLTDEKTIIGREYGAIIFPKDPFISPQHAEITFKDGQVTLTDLDSLNGIYWKMTGETRIVPGTYFRIGRQLLRLEVPGDLQPLQVSTPPNDDSQFWGSPVPQIWARLVQILEGGKIGEIYLLSLAEVALGRDEGEVRFPGDGTVSARHCLLVNREGDCFLRDLESSNGTFLRVQKSQPLIANDRIQIGTRVLRIDLD